MFVSARVDYFKVSFFCFSLATDAHPNIVTHITNIDTNLTIFIDYLKSEFIT